MHVHDSLQKLLDIEADHWGWEHTRVAHIFVQFTSSDEFLHDIWDLMGVSVAWCHRGLFLETYVPNDTFMVHSCCRLHLLSKQKEGASAEGRIVVAEDFNSVTEVVLATCGMVYFCRGAFAHPLP